MQSITKKKNMHPESFGSKMFSAVNGLILILLAAICLLPVINVLMISLSSNDAVRAGKVTFWPVDFTLSSYQYVAHRTAFWRAMGVTLLRCALGVTLNVLLCIMTAYPLSKPGTRFRGRTAYTWFFFLTMLINGGLIPSFMTVKSLHLLGTIWALVLPGAVPVFNVVLMINFFRTVPTELEEAAIVDGVGQMQILTKIFLPVCKPSVATIMLFSLVSHWNAWFDGIIYMNKPDQYPLQSYLNTIIIDAASLTAGTFDYQLINLISDRTVKCAQIFVSMVPILLLYPFLQRYFVKGMVMGSVKG